MKWEELRSRYPHFIYESYTYTFELDTFTCCFSFSIEGLGTFSPTWRIPLDESIDRSAYDDAMLRQLVFSLGMVEAISYWKIACPKTMLVRAGALSLEQIAFWQKLYFHGLGEFFHINQIDTTQEDFMCILAESPHSSLSSSTNLKNTRPMTGALIPIGGGKDSAVTASLLGSPENNCCFMIGSRNSSLNTARTAGYAPDQIITATRTIDPQMLVCNAQGFLNGHTPFSAIVAFSAVLTAYLSRKKYVVLSNESSANEPTVAGSDINHQYSKSFAFEADFSAYLSLFLPCGVTYFSLLRPLSELQIAGLFAQYTAYHPIFRSCNCGAKQDVWCGQCAKCLFVAIILSPFLPLFTLTKIFGLNLLDQPLLLADFQGLTGIHRDKPFECVGSREEVNTAICIAIARLQKMGEEIPYLYQAYMKSPQYAHYNYRENPYKTYYHTPHLLPKVFEEGLKTALHSIWES